MYSAFNTLQLELERLIMLRESMESSPSGQLESTKLSELSTKIYDHEQAIKLIFTAHQKRQAILAQHMHSRVQLN